MKLFQIVLLIALNGVFCPTAIADELEVTDQTLLEDLGADLLESTDEASQSVLDQRLLEQLGEDVGSPKKSQDDWLTRVITHMKTAQDRLQQSEPVEGASAAQGEALIGLDAMIAEITARQSQCKAGNCNKPGAPQPEKKNSSNGKMGNNPAQAAAGSTSSDADLSTDLAAAGQLVKDLWGKLPERQRQQILQPLSEEFLPKYAGEIEAYFRALAQPTGTVKDSQ